MKQLQKTTTTELNDLIIFMGPSASGKNQTIRALCKASGGKYDVVTTFINGPRPPRPGESNRIPLNDETLGLIYEHDALNPNCPIIARSTVIEGTTYFTFYNLDYKNPDHQLIWKKISDSNKNNPGFSEFRPMDENGQENPHYLRNLARLSILTGKREGIELILELKTDAYEDFLKILEKFGGWNVKTFAIIGLRERTSESRQRENRDDLAGLDGIRLEKAQQLLKSKAESVLEEEYQILEFCKKYPIWKMSAIGRSDPSDPAREEFFEARGKHMLELITQSSEETVEGVKKSLKNQIESIEKEILDPTPEIEIHPDWLNFMLMYLKQQLNSETKLMRETKMSIH